MKAPENIELDIVNYCINTLGLEFGTFWYEWWPSSKEGNYTLHINCNNGKLVEKIRSTFLEMPWASFIHSKGVQVYSLKIYEGLEFDFKYSIHFNSGIDGIKKG